MTDYSEVLINIQHLLKEYHNATLKCNFHKATTIAIKLSDKTFELERTTVRQMIK